VRLEDACLLIADCPHTTAPDEGEGYPLVRTPNVGFGRLVYDSMHRVSEEVYLGRNRRATPQAGDLIYAREAPAGNVAVIREGEKVCLGQRTVLLRPNPCIVDSNYLAYYLLAPENRHRLVSQASGATVAHVNIPVIRELPVSFPNLQKQQKAAAILNDLYSAIDNARRQIALLEEAAMRLYREWFVVKANPKWEKKRIVDVCVKIGAGGTPNRRQEKYWLNGTIAWIKTKELQDCWLFDSEEKITPAGLDGSSAKIYPENTVVMAIYASPTLGRLGIFDKPMCCNQAALCLVADESQVSWEWLYCQLFELRDEFNRIARGAGQQNISGEVVKETVVRIPDVHAMFEFTNAARPLFSQCRILGRQIGNLTEARDRLLPKLMSGEIEV